MISSLNIKNFKIHNDTSLQLRPLTVLTGMNGAGKSSVLQAMLLLRQSYMTHALETGLNLRGDLYDLGTAEDVECKGYTGDDDKVSFCMEFTDSAPLCFAFSLPKGRELEETLLRNAQPLNIPIAKLQDYSLFNNAFQYMSAFRSGPQKSYSIDTYTVEVLRQISKNMGQCEYAVNFLYRFKRNKVGEISLCINDTGAEVVDISLQRQVEQWMKRISPYTRISISKEGDSLRLNYKFERIGNATTDEIKSMNTGFGVTYVLPLLVGTLSAKKGSLLMIENPEAHLHPGGQAALMELLCKAAAEGIQIVLETHSDHIINGALVAVKKGMLNKDDLAICFFERDETSHTAICHQLEILDDGRISRPPKGFFDQMDIDLNILTGF